MTVQRGQCLASLGDLGGPDLGGLGRAAVPVGRGGKRFSEQRGRPHRPGALASGPEGWTASVYDDDR